MPSILLYEIQDGKGILDSANLVKSGLSFLSPTSQHHRGETKYISLIDF